MFLVELKRNVFMFSSDHLQSVDGYAFVQV